MSCFILHCSDKYLLLLQWQRRLQNTFSSSSSYSLPTGQSKIRAAVGYPDSPGLSFAAVIHRDDPDVGGLARGPSTNSGVPVPEGR